MRWYPILTPFKFNGAVRKSGHVGLNDTDAATLIRAGVIGRHGVDEDPANAIFDRMQDAITKGMDGAGHNDALESPLPGTNTDRLDVAPPAPNAINGDGNAVVEVDLTSGGSGAVVAVQRIRQPRH